MKKIAIIHPQLIEGGGSEAKALYLAEALKDEYEVTLLTLYSSSLNRLNECFGTNLTSSEIRIIEHPLANFFRNFRYFDAIRGAIFARFCRNFIDSFDLIISTYNIMNFNKGGIQFIADFSFSDELRRNLAPQKQGLKKIFYNKNILREFYLSFCKFLSGSSSNDFRENLTVANSNWGAKILRKEFGIESKVIYPPVAEEFMHIPWDKKEDGFIYIGRIVPEKRIDFIIEVLDRVRREGFDLHFHIIGPLYNSTYAEYLKKLSKTKGDWIKLEGAKFGEEKQEFLSGHKYGISAHPNESFGISVAEMIKAGEIVWVPRGGGQTEIVNNEDLLYNNFEDAVSKIIAVLKDDKKQKILRIHLAKQAKKFSAERFKKEVKELVEDYFRNE
ncbi:MAG: glycosyltransferase family 4 protein [candidate division WOR-3 bacterium]